MTFAFYSTEQLQETRGSIMTLSIRLLFLLLLASTGCNVAPRYKRPWTEAPKEWKHHSDESSECEESCPEPLPDQCFWWEIFQDPTLETLELQALYNNPTLYVALARIEEAWAIVGISRADLYPQLGLNPNYTDTGTLFKFYTPGGLVFPGVDPGLLTTPFRIHQMQYVLPLNISYELDLWGKYRNQVDSAYRHAQAQIEAYHAAMLSVTTNVASFYFNLRFLDATIDLLEETIAARRKTYELAKSRYEKGLTNYTDLASATLELANTESQYYDTKRQRGLQENALATLIGTTASELTLESMPLAQVPPNVPVGIPSEILLQRPDIAELEREMASEHALVGVAYTSFFPSFSLTGALGFSSPTFKDFLTWKSRLWAIGASVFQTVLDGGRKGSDLEAAWARFDQANGNYKQQVLVAFQEVEDALNDLEFQKLQSDSLQVSVESATKLLALSMNRYQKGLANYIEVVTNERSEIQAKVNYITILGARYQATIQLIRALGGSWTCPQSTDSCHSVSEEAST